MSLQNLYFITRAPKEFIRFYAGTLLLLVVFKILFDDWILVILYYGAFLIASIPFILIYNRQRAGKLEKQNEQMIKTENIQRQERTKKNLDKLLDKTKCMSCMSPVQADEAFCAKCGFELKK